MLFIAGVAIERSDRALRAAVRAQVGLSLFTDFENFRVFTPALEQKTSVNAMHDQVIA